MKNQLLDYQERTKMNNNIDMGAYSDTFKYLCTKEQELSEYLTELKKEYMRISKRGNSYAIDVMNEKYRATVAIYKDTIEFMKELLALQSEKQVNLK